MPIEIESPEQLGYDTITNNLSESSIADRRLSELDVVDLSFDDGWALDLDRVLALLRPGATKLLSVTCPHNPTGTTLDLAALDALVALAESSGAVLLVDETYRDLTHDTPLPMAASLSARAVSVSSMSKAYGLPGLRVGWAVCTDPELATTLLAAKEQIVICGATLDEAIAGRVLAARDRILPPILAEVRERLAIVSAWMAGQTTFEWVQPTGGVVGLVRARPDVALDTEAFYDMLLREHGTYVGPGHWFELDDRHFRLGFGWPTIDELHTGLAALTAAAEACAG